MIDARTDAGDPARDGDPDLRAPGCWNQHRSTGRAWHWVCEAGFFYWHGKRAQDGHLIPKHGTWQTHVGWERLRLRVVDGSPAELHISRRGEEAEVVLHLVDGSAEEVRAAVRRFMPVALVDDGGTVPEEFLSALRPDEVPLTFLWARVPGTHVRTRTFASILGFILVFDTVRNRAALPELRLCSLANGFPLDRKMAIVVTTKRLLIWRASPRRLMAPVLLGEVSRRSIASAHLPFVGGRGGRLTYDWWTGARSGFWGTSNGSSGSSPYVGRPGADAPGSTDRPRLDRDRLAGETRTWPGSSHHVGRGTRSARPRSVWKAAARCKSRRLQSQGYFFRLPFLAFFAIGDHPAFL